MKENLFEMVWSCPSSAYGCTGAPRSQKYNGGYLHTIYDSPVGYNHLGVFLPPLGFEPET
ncbi:hypothetical protein H5410_057615 [Solanum commersonii]|uniref:Uncharacterized protein n=1 Tax=Solanum commersonii TaxID=4109 RepID=A0A9J5WNK7_SOLCO|nr:hypothetical protein H5410_057615 [Solanum commersonii]